MDKFRAKILLEQKRDQLHLESFMRHDNIQKSQPEDINPFDKFEEDIQKGKSAAIGETRMWNGKKMRKQANGKWVEVSEHGKTKKEHGSHIMDLISANVGKKLKDKDNELVATQIALHKKYEKELSDKEYDDSELEGDIQKGKKASIGEIRVWNGKKVKKVAEGKWVEVSEHGMTKKEHGEAAQKFGRKADNINLPGGPDAGRFPDLENKRDIYSKYYQSHMEQASKLSDKEYTDEEVGGGEEEDIKVGGIVLSFDTNKITLFKELQKEPDKYRDVIQYMESKGANWDKINMIKVGRMILDAQK